MTSDNHSLESTIQALSQPGKGILAADESLPTIAKRFASIDVESSEANRRDYRALLCETESLEQFISGVILFEETLSQRSSVDISLPDTLAEKGIVPGIKVDRGTIPLHVDSPEKLTQGLDGLGDRLAVYRDQGARFAKWRNVYVITGGLAPTPSELEMTMGAEILGRYAAICQQNSIVPIVEPEVLMDGDHSIERCAEATLAVQHHVFDALYRHGVDPAYMLLKPNMILPGVSAPGASPEAIAAATLEVLYRTVPAAVPSINFLSGGQSPEEATANLNAINALAAARSAPWLLSFSYGRALQQPVLSVWGGDAGRKPAAQQALKHRAELNAAAVRGEYDAARES